MGSQYLMFLAAMSIASPAVAAALPPTAAPTAQSLQPMTRAEFLANLQTRFNAIDSNHDGQLAANEIEAAQQKELAHSRASELLQLEGKFNRLDANHDGQVSKTEFMAAAPPLQARQSAQQVMEAFDSNKDGKVSAQEYETKALANFNKTANSTKKVTQTQFLASVHARVNEIDSNHDGYLETNEIAAEQQKDLARQRAAEVQQFEAEFNRLDANHDGQISKSEFMTVAAPAPPIPAAQQMISTLDANKDGKISLQEYTARPLANFDKLDANHDGIVTPQEVETARAAIKR